MKIRLTIIAPLALALGLTAAANAQPERAEGTPPDLNAKWLAAKDGDLVPGGLVGTAATLPPPRNTDRTPATFSWPLAPEAVLAAADTGHTGESRQYWLDVSGRDLARGAKIHTVSRGAVIRISPLAGDGTQLRAQDLRIEARGRALDRASAVASLATAAQLRAAGADFPEGTLAFRLRPEVAPGELRIRMANAGRPDDRFVVHVHEPASDVVATVGTGRGAYLAGETVAIEFEVANAEGDVTGFAMSPDGKTIETLVFDGSGSRASAVLPAPAAGAVGLWEIQAMFDGRAGDLRVRRDVKTAIQIAAPTARLTDAVDVDRRDAGLAFEIGVLNGVAGRYQAAGILYGTRNGSLQPMGAAHSAAWLEPGTGRIELVFDAAIVAQEGFKPPYELRDLRLYDQTRVSLLQRQSRAIAID